MAVPDSSRPTDAKLEHPPSVLHRFEVRRTVLEYEAILQNAWVGILFTRGRRVLHCNARFASLFGYAPR